MINNAVCKLVTTERRRKYLVSESNYHTKQKITDKTGKDGIKDVQIMVPWKYLSNLCRTLEMSLINCDCFSLGLLNVL